MTETLTHQFTGVPSFFRANCQTASGGGTGSYSEAGYHLAIHMGERLRPDDIESKQWAAEIAALDVLIDRDDTAGAWTWFTQRYPRCMELVPARRKAQFLHGVKRASEEGSLG